MIFKEIPLKHKIKAIWQWLTVGLVLCCAWLVGLVMAFFATLTSKKMPNAFGEITQQHSEKYRALGSSGMWCIEQVQFRS